MLKSILTTPVTFVPLLICILSGLVLGLATALLFRWRHTVSSGLCLTVTLLPAIVCVIIMLVNGSIGAGLGVAGAFSLIRFRSTQGSARELAAVFTAVGIGLALGMGYVGIAVLLFLAVALAVILLTLFRFGEKTTCRQLRITIPEDLDYNGLFDDVFAKYNVHAELRQVRTSAMGTLFDLTYDITLPSASVPKAFMDELRVLNGNLHLSVGVIPEQTQL